MNSKYNEIVKAYLNQKTTDFAIQIDGPWGCGKTYYVDNELTILINSQNKKLIKLSLNGLSKLEDLNSKILYSYLKEEKISKHDKIKKTTDTLGSMWLELAPTFETLNSVVKVTGLISKFANEKLNFDNYVLLFDDLERVSSEIKVADLFGFIFDNFTSKGIKTIFISNELEIKDSEYVSRKEKIIRRTISYLPDFNKQIDSFLNKKFAEKKELIDSHKDFFISRLEKKGIRNLRTIAFIFDNFFYVLDNISDIEIKAEAFDMLFINILLLTDEYKNGRITKEDLKDYKKLNDVNLAYFNAAQEKTQTYASIFYSTYNSASGLEFTFIKAIFDYIITGYLDKKSLEQKLVQLYKPYSEQEEAFRKINNIQELEQDELITIKNQVISYMKKGEYHLMILPKLYRILKYIKERNYIEDFSDDLKSLFLDAFEKCAANNDNVPEYSDMMFDTLSLDIEIRSDPVFLELKRKITEKSLTKQSDNTKQKIKLLFEQANDREVYVKEYERGELFSDIVNTNSIDNFFMLDNFGISYFQSYLRQTILNTDKPWQTDRKSRDALITITEYIKSNLETKAINHMRKQRLNDLLEMMNTAIQCLEEPKKETTNA